MADTYYLWTEERAALAKLEAETSGRGRLFEFGGGSNYPDYVAMAPREDGTWVVKFGTTPAAAIDFAEGQVDPAPSEGEAHALAMEIANGGNCAECIYHDGRTPGDFDDYVPEVDGPFAAAPGQGM